MEKKYLIVIIILLAMFGLGGMLLIGYADGNYNMIGKEIQSWDGKYSIAVPHGWKKCDGASANALIGAERGDSGMYTQVSLDAFDYAGEYGILPTVDQYITNYISYISGNSDDPALTKMLTFPVDMEIEGVKGMYYEFVAKSDDMMVYFYCFAAYIDSGFVTIEVAVKESDQEEGIEVAKSIIRSFRINAPETEVQETESTGGEAEPTEDNTAETE